MPATISVALPDSVVRAAEVQARLLGVSLEDWIARAVTERLDTQEGAREYFRQKAAGATREDLRRVLDKVPNRQPDRGTSCPSRNG